MSTFYIPDDRSMRNPIRDYPRNLPCPCQSGKKFKKCCYLTTPDVVRKGKGKDELAQQLHAMKKIYKARRKNAA